MDRTTVAHLTKKNTNNTYQFYFVTVLQKLEKQDINLHCDKIYIKSGVRDFWKILQLIVTH